jgi:AcrR family transcriptional regulator
MSQPPTSRPAAALPGRQAEAARNDQLILEAARAVFVADPGAPVSEVAKRAGVGIAALYRRYPSKEDMLRKLSGDGLHRYIAAAEAALADDEEPWASFATFMRRVVEADTHSLTRSLAGTFTPTEELYRDAARAQELNVALFERLVAAHAVRSDVVVDDIGWILEMVAAVRLRDPQRTRDLRERYLALLLDGLRAPTTVLPGPPPNWPEISERWNP